ncbi:MAG: ATP-grasp domain-containing protein [Methanococcoides sp.]|nr:ATP-grasp domain-containing protein [Methanococcoides sp.]
MKILLSEYAVSTGMSGTYLLEGKAMLYTLASSFSRLGHEVIYTTSDTTIEHGKPVRSSEEDIEATIRKCAKECDAGLVIAPEEILPGLTAIIEDNTLNLGCSPDAVSICSDKLECTRMLENAGLAVPRTYAPGQKMPLEGCWVTKPRYGCASEDTFVCHRPEIKSSHIATEYIEGEHLSVSLICGKEQLPLTVNAQRMEIDPTKDASKIEYCGCTTPYRTDREQELYDVAKKATRALGCNGYIGVDIILGDRPYIVDVNPRPTTSLVGITKIMDKEIAELLLKNGMGETLPEIKITGEYSFTKEELR